MTRTKTKRVVKKRSASRKPKPRTSVQDEFREESRYMAAEDVENEGGEVELTIKKSKREKMPNDGELKRCVYWEEPDFKPLPLNKTNGRYLVKNVSEFAEEWSGTRLRLYTVDTTKGPGVRFDLADEDEPDAVDEDVDDEDDLEEEDDDLD